MNGRLFQTPQTRKSVDYGSGLNNNKSSEEININTPTQARRNQSMGNIFRRLDESLTRTEKQLGSQNNLLNLSIDQEADLSARQATSTQIPRRTVATLSDPSKPSSTQSRTFRLLQQTLDCGKFQQIWVIAKKSNLITHWDYYKPSNWCITDYQLPITNYQLLIYKTNVSYSRAHAVNRSIFLIWLGLIFSLKRRRISINLSIGLVLFKLNQNLLYIWRVWIGLTTRLDHWRGSIGSLRLGNWNSSRLGNWNW